MASAVRAEVAVIGGSGFYRWLEDAETVVLDTPWGAPSDAVTVGRVGGRSVAFLPRHGADHRHPPHLVPYRANLWALRSLGVTRVLAPCAVGSLRPDLAPGDLVVLDQLVDRTGGRAQTYLDGPDVGHVSFAEPYCPETSAVLADAASSSWPRVARTGTVVVIDGPRFSTRAESRWYRDQGWDVVNMTQHPEAVLARELGMCFAAPALVTDWDAGVEGDPAVAPVTMDDVLGVLAANVARLRDLLSAAVPALPTTRRCGCAGLGAPQLAGVGPG